MKKLVICFSILLLVASCGAPRKVGVVSHKSPYDKNVGIIHPQFEVFHVSERVSELHFKVHSKELLYTRADGINLSSNVLISYFLMASADSKIVLDSASLRLLDKNNNNVDKDLIGKIDFKTNTLDNYIMKITVADLNRNISTSSSLVIEKDNDSNRQNFIIKSIDAEVSLFRNYVKSGEKVAISYKMKTVEKLFVRYYNRAFPLAKPPFSGESLEPFTYQEDSLFVLKASPEGSFNFTTEHKGFYHFQVDTSSRKGITIFNFSDSFPDVKKVDEMLPPLRYITSSLEYFKLVGKPDKKEAVESFWLSSASNQDRARDLIHKYYNRVQNANRYFSSYIEGWRTDRGMLYLIYGAPSITHTTPYSETWVYEEKSNVNTLSYSFLKVNNPFSDNDYILERTSYYKQPWFMAVDVWRQGRISLLE